MALTPATPEERSDPLRAGPISALPGVTHVTTGPAGRITWIDVDPKGAATLLQRNKNRTLRPSVVERYTGEMQRGAWIPNGTDPIVIDTNGDLRNGQHRLWAVIKSGTTQRFLLVRGADPGSFAAMDIGAGRQPGDVLGIAVEDTGDKTLGAGMRSSEQKDAAAAVRLLERMEERPHFPFTGVWNTRNRLTAGEIAGAFTGKWGREVVAVQPWMKQIRASGVLGGGGVWLALLVLMRRLSPEDTAVFVEQVATGTNLSPGSPTLALRNRLLRGSTVPLAMRSSRSMGAYVERTNQYARSIAYAWNAFREGRDVTRLSVNLDRPFPYPK